MSKSLLEIIEIFLFFFLKLLYSCYLIMLRLREFYTVSMLNGLTMCEHARPTDIKRVTMYSSTSIQHL